MRVIAGSARRLLLKTPEGMETRPTQDRIKETLFNILQDDVPGCRFLDLFAGSGAIGIEALSRGAAEAVFVDSGKKPVMCIKDNLVHTKLDTKGIVLCQDVNSAILSLDSGDVFDIVFMDPPYNQGFEENALKTLKNSNIINEDSLIIIEASLETKYDYIDGLGYSLIKEKQYKTNKHIFLKRISE